MSRYKNIFILVLAVLCIPKHHLASDMDSLRVLRIEKAMISGMHAYNSENISEALEYFTEAYRLTPTPYNTDLKLNVVKNYLALLGLGEDYKSFQVISKSVLRETRGYVDCNAESNALFLGLLTNIGAGASYNEDTGLAMVTYDMLVDRISSCGLDSINLAQSALNLSRLLIETGDATRAKEYLRVGQRYRGSHYPEYDAELSFIEARSAFADLQFERAKMSLLRSSNEFMYLGNYPRALTPINWGIQRLGPFLDSADFYELVLINIQISDSLGVTDESAELRLVKSLVRTTAVQNELMLSEHKKTTLVTVVSLLFVIVGALLSLILFKRQSNSIKALKISLIRRKKQEERLRGQVISIRELEQFGLDLLKGDLEALNGKELMSSLQRKFPDFTALLMTYTAEWTTGDREILIATILGYSPKTGADVLKTTPNSFRARKSKMLNRIPKSFRKDIKAWISKWR